MPKKKFPIMFAATVIAALIIAGTVAFCVKSTRDKMTQYSFDDLTEHTLQLAADIRQSAEVDELLLQVTAELVASRFDQGEEAILEAMNAIDRCASFVSSIELLTPGNWMLYQDGTYRSTEGVLDFEQEVQKGSNISERSVSIKDPTDLVVRCSEPVVRNGETVAVLYGVISLKNYSDGYDLELYNGEAFMLVTDGTSGDILMDTWHNELGNMNSMNDREMLPGYSFAKARQAMLEGRSGDLAVVSRSVGEPLYLHFEPIGINNWNVTVGVKRALALQKTRDCTANLYWMAGIIAVTVLLYMGLLLSWLARSNRRMYELSVTDQGTGLQNRSAYELYLQKNQDRLFSQVTCIYVDVDDLHELNNRRGHAAGDAMLHAVAEGLCEHFAQAEIYRIGGDEFVALLTEDNEQQCEARMQRLVEQLHQKKYSISYGIVCRTQEQGLESLIQKADERMLTQKRTHHSGVSGRDVR